MVQVVSLDKEGPRGGAEEETQSPLACLAWTVMDTLPQGEWRREHLTVNRQRQTQMLLRQRKDPSPRHRTDIAHSEVEMRCLA